MAQMAAAETLWRVLGESERSLFGADPAAFQRAVAGLGTVKRFGTLARHFFGRLTFRFAASFLTRESSAGAGGPGRFGSAAGHAAFVDALAAHCHETALAVERFSGEWLSKELWERGEDVPPDRVRDFVHGAMSKMAAALGAGEDGGGR